MKARPALGWRLSELAEEVGGALIGTDAVVDLVQTDSRSVERGSLFIALEGATFDGHDFVERALDEGAAGILVRADSTDRTPRIEVDDTLEALLALGAKRRSELHMPVIAVTGSTGKTSTKDLLAAGIEGAYASPRSYNNEIGVPLTVLGAPSDASALVLEVGSRGRGHIQWLTGTVRPDVSVITNLGVVHLETFGTELGLADAKFELAAMLGPEGVAVFPVDEDRLVNRDVPSLVTFGSDAADVVIDDVELDDAGCASFTLRARGRAYPVTLSVAGRHQAMNAAAAAAAAMAIGIDLADFTARLGLTTGSDWRMDVHHGSLTVVNDAYNANPQSVEAALRTVAEMPGGKHIAVLGPMSELGQVCEREHRRMGEVAAEVGFDAVIVVGPDHGYVLGAPTLVSNATDLEEAADTLHRVSEPGDVVLVKASRSAGLERLALDLIQDAQP